MKIEELFEESIKQNYANIMVKSEERKSFKMNRRRSSLFQQPVILKQAEEQAKRMPKRARLFFAGIWSLTATFYLTVGVLQLSATVKCHPLLWEHCKVKVPFCRSLFAPRCNCAVLSIEGHNMTRLPLEIEDMTGLRLVTVSKGPLVLSIRRDPVRPGALELLSPILATSRRTGSHHAIRNIKTAPLPWMCLSRRTTNRAALAPPHLYLPTSTTPPLGFHGGVVEPTRTSFRRRTLTALTVKCNTNN